MPKICTSKNPMIVNLNQSLDFNGYVKKLKPNNKAKKQTQEIVKIKHSKKPSKYLL